MELTFNRLLSGQWLKQAKRHNLAKRLVHKQWGINDFVVSSRKTLRIISQDARNVNSGRRWPIWRDEDQFAGKVAALPWQTLVQSLEQVGTGDNFRPRWGDIEFCS